MSSLALAVSRRNRRTPYTDRIGTLGVQGLSMHQIDLWAM